MGIVLRRGRLFSEEGMFFLHASDKGGFCIRLLVFRGFWDVDHHDDTIDRVDGSCALVWGATAIVFAARTFISWAVIHDVSKEVAESTGIVVIFRSRAMNGIEAFLFGIPKSPSKSALIVEQYSLLTR